jgi:hypothetical protein
MGEKQIAAKKEEDELSEEDLLRDEALLEIADRHDQYLHGYRIAP